jgi:hypothetical protein
MAPARQYLILRAEVPVDLDPQAVLGQVTHGAARGFDAPACAQEGGDALLPGGAFDQKEPAGHRSFALSD